MIGLGLGPLTVGLLSDTFAAPFGEENLRYAMLTTLTVSIIGIFFLWRGARTLISDLALSK